MYKIGDKVYVKDIKAWGIIDGINKMTDKVRVRISNKDSSIYEWVYPHEISKEKPKEEQNNNKENKSNISDRIKKMYGW